MDVNLHSPRQTICIFSHDRIFSHLLSGLVRYQFNVVVSHEPRALVYQLEHSNPILVLADGALLEEATLTALINSKMKRQASPHVLFFASATELQELDSRSLSCIDKIMMKPAGTEDIIGAVLEMTT